MPPRLKSKLRPVSVDELEAEFAGRFPPDGSLEGLGDAWRRVRSVLSSALNNLKRAPMAEGGTSGMSELVCLLGAGAVSSGPKSLSTTAVDEAFAGGQVLHLSPSSPTHTTLMLDLADFTARYTSLGGEYAQAMRLPWCGVLGVLVGIVRLESDFFELLDDEMGDVASSVVVTPEAVSRLRTFFAKASEITANCCSNASETRSDWVLLPVRNAPSDANDDFCGASGSSVLSDEQESKLKVQVGFPPFALAETAARVWGGSTFLSLMWFDLLTSKKRPPPPHQSGSGDGCRRRNQADLSDETGKLELLELGCGCAMPSCSLVRILYDLLGPVHGDGESAIYPSQFALDTLDCGTASGILPPHVTITVSDWQQVIVTQALQNAKKNWKAPAEIPAARMLTGSVEHIQVHGRCDEGDEGGDTRNDAFLVAPLLTIRGEVIDFFEINSPAGRYSSLPSRCDEKVTTDCPTSRPRTYDLIYGSDIVYDFKIGAEVATALKKLLRPPGSGCHPTQEDQPNGDIRSRLENLLANVFRSVLTPLPDTKGGVALICCEGHRDGMRLFHQQVLDAGLRVLLHSEDGEKDILKQFALPPNTTETTCVVYLLGHA